MESPGICPSCKNPLLADSPLGELCPSCLIKSGFYSESVPPDVLSSKNRTSPSLEALAPLFPQLEIIKLIGRGGMGTVYKARQPKLNRFVALKILAREGDEDARFPSRFQREAQSLARLNHPNIVTVYDFGETGGLFYLLMEFVDGLNLRQLEQSAKMAAHEALTIIPPICDALQYAHSQGIVHRDIKPENILLDKSGRIKIADFGIAKILGTESAESLTGEQQRIGTPHYMAPEQVETPTIVDHRADIYSLGVVFYEMLTGELPLGRFAPPSKKVQIDIRLDEIVLRALEKDPELRFQQVSEIGTQVESVATSEILKREEPSIPFVLEKSQSTNFNESSADIHNNSGEIPQRPITWLFLIIPVLAAIYYLVINGLDQFGVLFFFIVLTNVFILLNKPRGWKSKIFSTRTYRRFAQFAAFVVALIIFLTFAFRVKSVSLSEPELLTSTALTLILMVLFVILGIVVDPDNAQSARINKRQNPVSGNLSTAWQENQMGLSQQRRKFTSKSLAALLMTLGVGIFILVQRKPQSDYHSSGSSFIKEPNRTGSSNNETVNSSGNILSFSSGITAMLQGVGEFSSDQQNWSAANGSPVVALSSQFNTLNSTVVPALDGINRQFFIELSNLPANEDVRADYQVGQSFEMAGEGIHKGSKKFIRIGASLPASLKTTSVSLGIASDSWHYLTESSLDSTFTGRLPKSQEFYKIALSPVTIPEDRPQITISDNGLNVQYNVTLLDSSGNSYPSIGSTDSGHQRTTYYFNSNTSGVLFVKARLSFRPYEWQTFEHVQLYPVTQEQPKIAGTMKTDYAFKSTTPYIQPSFESYFPDDSTGGIYLDELWTDPRKNDRSDAEIFRIMRNGLYRTHVDRSNILRWFGNKYIWNKSPQKPQAIELMYHAADARPEIIKEFQTLGPAIYFGLSVVNDKTSAILRTLVDIAMKVDDPSDLSRIQWGTQSHRAETLKLLLPYLQSNDSSVKEKADIVEKIITGKLGAFDWQNKKAAVKAQEQFGSKLPKIKTMLTSGTSTQRKEQLETILRERLSIIMDESFIPAFEASSKDPDPVIRKQVAIIAGERWIWTADQQSSAVIILMMNLARDEDREVKYNAVYYGLSTVRDKEPPLIRLLLELAIDDREPNFYHRIAWALKTHREATKSMLYFLINEPDEKKAQGAHEIYKDMTGEELNDNETD